jgi:Predicted signal transduction protein with a C-terminal ATPase domain
LIQKKIFLYISSLVVMMLISISVIVYFYFFQTMREKEMDSAVRYSNGTKQSVELILSFMNKTVSSISRNANVIHALSGASYLGAEEEVNSRTVVNSLIYNLVSVHEYIRKIEIIGNREKGAYFSTVFDDVEGRIGERNAEIEAMLKNCYKDAAEAYYFLCVNDKVISFVVPIFQPQSGYRIGFLVIDINRSYLEEIVATTTGGADEKVLIVTAENETVLSYPYTANLSEIIEQYPQLLDMNQTRINGKIFGKESIIVSDSISYSNWRIVRMIDTAKINTSMNQLGQIGLFALLFFLIVSFLASYRLSIYFTTPIIELNRKIKQFEKGDMDTRIEITRTDELGQLSNSFNKMVVKLDSLLKTAIEQEQKKSEMEFQLLQSQINPHFLYNTLDSIRWLAVIQNVENIGHMTTSLIQLLKYSISHKGRVVTLEEEINMIKNYITIQKYRYGDIFEVVYDIEDEAWECCVLNLILQPLVENAIYHGMESKEEGGLIRIEAHVRNGVLLEISVIDNGAGMDEKEWKSGAGKDKKMHTGIGLKNVEERIKLYFGEPYGLRIRSVSGKGTEMTIVLPKKYREQV